MKCERHPIKVLLNYYDFKNGKQFLDQLGCREGYGITEEENLVTV
jgi:hypothetical protein